MNDSVQTNFINQLITNNNIPFIDWMLTGYYQCFFLISVVYDLLKVSLLTSFKYFHAKVIYDLHVDAREFLHESYFLSLQSFEFDSIQ